MNKIMKIENRVKEYQEYLKIRKNFSSHTIHAYIKDINSFIQYLKERKSILDLTDVNHHLLRKYVVHLKNKKYAQRTIARKISSCRVFYRYLMQQGLINQNPAEYIQLHKVNKKLPDFLFYEEIIQFINAIKTDQPISIRNRAIIELLYGTGMRVTELSSLNVDDIHIQVLHNENYDIIKVTGKGFKERLLPLSKTVKDALEAYKEIKEYTVRPKYRHLISKKPLFLNCFGKRLSPRSIFRMINKYMALSSLNKRISPHVFRHTFATHLLNGGANLLSVQELLGHESLSTTQIYTHVTKDKLIKTYKNCIPRK